PGQPSGSAAGPGTPTGTATGLGAASGGPSAGPGGTATVPADLPRATTSGRPLSDAAASPTTVVAPEGGGQVPTYRGPSTGGQFGGSGSPVPSGTAVDVYCGLYAQQVNATGSPSRLWVYTDEGWIPAGYVQTGQTPPSAAPACAGTVSSPKVGSGSTSPATGPFPIVQNATVLSIVGGVVNSLTEALLGAEPSRRLVNGDLVTLLCHSVDADGVTWDQLAGGGWVEHRYVYSGTSGSPAPRC
ncbi:hypothetical protein I6A84_27085, partial [Frankia sp. CNm7]|nr:hypothetical protein [Frankia nepalensis]